MTAQVNKAWTDACNSKAPAKLLVPRGEWLVGELKFTGPCTNPAPITIEVQGTLKAKPDLGSFPSGMWINIFQTSVQMIGGGTLHGQGEAVWNTKKPGDNAFPDSVVFSQCKSSSIENIKIVNSKGFNLKAVQSDGFKANMLNISCAEDSSNTDGIHIGKLKGVSITNTVISVGDDCISVGDDSRDITITNVTCGPGHGISIGSLGRSPDEKDVKNVAVSNCTFRNTANGARIKTFHESPVLQASNISFTDIILDKVFNPIIIDQNYFAKKPGASKVKITGVHYKNFKGSSMSNKAIILKCSDAVPCEAIDFTDIDLTYAGESAVDKDLKSECVNAKPKFGGKMNPVGC
ncbi:polygalacturonase-like [Apium graveolens]|uniref:polygalacturonase-like n=1 Tax=Apium graveolens TaxID=4045 RepID=UPI003D7B917E